MKHLRAKAFGGLGFMLFVMAGAIFLPAGTFNYWQGWVFLATFGISVAIVTLYVAVRDPQLLERRMKAGPGAEKEKVQKIVQFIAQFVFLFAIVVPALDHRLAWSRMPSWLPVAGDALVALGLMIVLVVFKENTFAAATIEVGAGQKVVSTGLYAIVRHPMYSGGIVMLAGMPIALGSWWGLLVVPFFILVLHFRIANEEKVLLRDLEGYKEYRQKVRYRLMPGIY